MTLFRLTRLAWGRHAARWHSPRAFSFRSRFTIRLRQGDSGTGVIARGNAGQPIFPDDQDRPSLGSYGQTSRRCWLETLGGACVTIGGRVKAIVLMDRCHYSGTPSKA